MCEQYANLEGWFTYAHQEDHGWSVKWVSLFLTWHLYAHRYYTLHKESLRYTILSLLWNNYHLQLSVLQFMNLI